VLIIFRAAPLRSSSSTPSRAAPRSIAPVAAMVLLDENAVKSMAPGRFFRDHKAAINSLDFHHTEDVLATVGASFSRGVGA
jgi:hypothetical protein|tara:strand:- start:15 stop:257 length:243 start_codon:yes stop_codon:yes gene_type:complete